MKKTSAAFIVSLVTLCAASARADVRLPPAISDHMVLQCDAAAPIWGFAAPGEEVSVSIAGQTKSVTADAVIEGDRVVVSSAAVAQPSAVRYARSGNAPWANLFNKDGLPAQTFRTDNW